MTISSETNSVTYNGPGNGFAYNFPVFDFDDLVVEVQDADGVITTKTKDGIGTYDYTVAGTYNTSTYRYPSATITLNNALPAGFKVYIINDVAATQATDYTVGGDIDAERLETNLDRIVVMVQRSLTRFLRTLKIAGTAGITPTDLQPVADGYIKFNAAGTDIEVKALGTIGTVTLPLSEANGGTGVTSTAALKTALALGTAADGDISTDVQAYDAALSSFATFSGTLAEGDIIYATGPDALAKLAIGSEGDVVTVASGLPSYAAPAISPLVQIETAVHSGTAISTTSTSFVAATGMSITITGVTSGNRLVIRANVSSGHSTTGDTLFQIRRGTTDITAGSKAQLAASRSGGSGAIQMVAMTQIDTDHGGGSVTYNLYWSTNADTTYLGRTGDNTFLCPLCTFTVEEYTS